MAQHQDPQGEPTAQPTPTANAEGFDATAFAAGQQAERERVSAILALPAAEGRTALAHQCIATGLSADQAAAILAAAPAPTAPAAATAGPAFAAAMAAMDNPDVSGIEGPSDAIASASQLAGEVISAFRSVRA